MKKNILLYFILFGSLVANSQSKYTISSIPGPKLDTLYSDIVGDDYRLLITLPFGFSSSKEYPVLYYLDALGTSGMMNEVASAKMWSRRFDPMILVGISYDTNPLEYGKLRDRDYMPPINEKDTITGGDEFLQFIKTELIPYMEQNYSADPEDRGLMGYSLGGLFSAWAFKKEPSLFHKLAIISPSLWYGDEFLFEDKDLLKNIDNAKGINVFIACGSLESSNMISNSDRLFGLFNENKTIQSTSVIFEGETHGSVSYTAMIRGLYNLYENKYKALIKEGSSYYKKQNYKKAIEKYELAFATSPKKVDVDDQYDIACFYALDGNPDKAFQYLKILAKSGMDDYNHVTTDTDLKSLHLDKRWNDFVSRIKENKVSKN